MERSKVKKIIKITVAALLFAALFSVCVMAAAWYLKASGLYIQISISPEGIQLQTIINPESGSQTGGAELTEIPSDAETGVLDLHAAGSSVPDGPDPHPDSAAGETAPAPLSSGDHYRTTYEVFVYSFADAAEGALAGDGIGDLQGLLEKLDYINDGDPETGEDLGCNGLWLMPIFPSPTYHKYDTADYCAIDPVYGSMEDFEKLLAACHERGMTVILDLALNHTSTEHPWFQKALAYMRTLQPFEDIDLAAEPCYSYYNFQNTARDGWKRLNLSDSRDPNREWYYEARFWEGMPDLNLDNEALREEIRNIVSFWLKKGVDGFRLDAVSWYYTEDQKKNMEFLSWLNGTVKEINPDAYIVGEAWTAQDSYAEYYASGIDSLFDFAFSGPDGVIAQVAKGSRGAGYYAAMLAAEEEKYGSKNKSYVNAPFYTNHDMARSAGYYAYDDGTRVKFAEGLNLMMPGCAYLYYGEELGMKGSGRDENKRAPMYWTSEADGKDAPHLTDGPPGMEDFAMKFPAASDQTGDEDSILSYIRQAVRIRSAFPAIRKGRTVVDETLSDDTLAVFAREAEGEETVFIFINSAEETRRVPLDKLKELKAGLRAGEEEIRFSEGILELPPFGIAVMQ